MNASEVSANAHDHGAINASEVSANVHDHGKVIDRQKNRVQCNYCAKMMSGFSRLRYHLGCVKGDVAPCGEVPENVKELMKTKLLELKRGSLGKEVGNLEYPDLPWKRKLYPSPSSIEHRKLQTTQKADSDCTKDVQKDSVSENGVTKDVPLSKGKNGSQKVVNHKEREDSSSRQAKKCIGRCFYELGADLSATVCPSFQRMITATLGCGQIGYKLPSFRDLKGWILKEEVNEMQQYVKDVRNSWASTGCSILLDGWMDEKGRNLINVLVDCPKSTIYIRSYDISACIADVDVLQFIIEEIIEEVGIENVVQIITYSISDSMVAVGQRIMEKFRTVFWTVSASHCIELMLEKIGMMDPTRGILDRARTITKFIHSHATVLKLMRNYTSADNLVKPSKIKWAKAFLTLENLLSEKDNLQNMFVSAGWNSLIWASREEGKRVAALVVDPTFWTGARMVLKATIPLVRILSWINGGDKSQMGYIYDTMDQAKEAIAKEFKHKKSHYMPFWEVIDEIWNKHLYSPLHSTGYYLNPHFLYSSDFHCDAEVASGMLCCIVRMVPDLHVQDVIGLQLHKYLLAEGDFAQGSAFDQRANTPPVLWWSRYGQQHPEFQRFATRILSQTCDGASRYELKKCLAEKLLMKGRNPIEQQRLCDLTFLHYNLHLQSFKSRLNTNIVLEEIDPMDEWIVEDANQSWYQNCDSAWMDLDCEDTTINEDLVHGKGSSGIQPKVETGF